MKIGYQSMVINPTSPQKPVGHLIKTNNLSLVKGDCTIRCFYVENEKPLLFVTIDVYAVSTIVINKMKDIAQSFFKKELDIIVSATHTHSAPSLFNGFNVFSQNSNFIEYVLERFEICLIKLKTKTIDCHIRYDVSEHGFLEFTKDPNGLIRLQLLSFYDQQKPLGHWIVFNAHPTLVAADAHYFSSDYIGALLEKLQRKFPFEFFMFFQGACGDVFYQNKTTSSTFQDSVKVSNLLFHQLVKLINQEKTAKPTDLILQNISIPINHRIKTMNDFEASDEQTKQQAQDLLPKVNEIKSTLLKKTEFQSFKTSQCHFVFTPYKWYSSYQKKLDDHVVLINLSNGYHGNITDIQTLPLRFDAIFETIKATEKEKLLNHLKQL